MYCIYRTTNLINGKTYVGQHRFENVNDSYLGSGRLIRRAIKKYGKENFKKEIIISGDFTQEQIDKFERCMIFFERFNGKSEYNIDNGGNGVGRLSEETKRKISENNGKGMLGKRQSDDAKRKISAVHKGKHLSEETKKKLSDFNKGQIAWNKGMKMSDDFCKKCSEAQKGKRLSEETKAKLSKSHKGNKFSEETKRKMSEARKGHTTSEDTRKKISDTLKGHKHTTKVALAYKDYKANGGTLSWNDFQKEYKKQPN